MYCPYCGERNSDTAKACGRCGRWLPAKPTAPSAAETTRPCPNCGQAVPATARACGHCGQWLVAQPPTPPPAAGPPKHGARGRVWGLVGVGVAVMIIVVGALLATGVLSLQGRQVVAPPAISTSMPLPTLPSLPTQRAVAPTATAEPAQPTHTTETPAPTATAEPSQSTRIPETPAPTATAGESAKAYHEAAEDYMREEDLDAALEAIDKAIELDPDKSTYYYRRGVIYILMGLKSQALPDWTRAAEMDHDNTLYFRNLSWLQAETGDYEQALTSADRAVEVEPDDAENYHFRGWLIREYGGDCEAALADFDRAIALDPDGTRYRERCITLNCVGQHAAALEDCNRCLDLTPENEGCYFDRAWAHDGIGDVGAAVADFEQYLALVPADVCPDCQEQAQTYVDEYGR
jgi:Flp pilus assembly protein TadD